MSLKRGVIYYLPGKSIETWNLFLKKLPLCLTCFLPQSVNPAFAAVYLANKPVFIIGWWMNTWRLSVSGIIGWLRRACFDRWKLDITQVEATQNGFIYVYLSNESASSNPVYFDDLKVTVNEHPVIHADDYYPFGLTFNSHQRVTSKQNDYLYNGKELQDELNLNWLDYGARMYDPAMGRWHVLDPLGEKYLNHSPYNYTMNNPIKFIDPDGMKVKWATYKQMRNNEDIDSEKKFETRKEYRQARREVKRASKELRANSQTAETLYKDLDAADEVHTMYVTKSAEGHTEFKDNGDTDIAIGTDFSEGLMPGTNSQKMSVMTTTAHEWGHAWRFQNGLDRQAPIIDNVFDASFSEIANLYSSKVSQETGASHIENIVRGELQNSGFDVSIRQTYSGLFPTPRFQSDGKVRLSFQGEDIPLLDASYNQQGYLTGRYKLNAIKK